MVERGRKLSFVHEQTSPPHPFRIFYGFAGRCIYGAQICSIVKVPVNGELCVPHFGVSRDRCAVLRSGEATG